MRKIKIGYVLFLILCLVIFYSVFPTYAKFSSDYTTGNDVVGVDLNFNIGISNIEEYQEIKVSPNSHRAFNIEINNYSDSVIYYGVWYKMISPKDISDKIKIARVNSTEVPTYGDIDGNDKKIVGLVIINNSDEAIKVAIGVGSSNESVSDIEYLSGKHLVVDYANIPINKEASLYIKDLYNSDQGIKTVNIAGNTSKAKIFVNEDKGIILDNNGEYRYYGSDPKNYVRFNNELWRIVSVSKVYSDSSLKNGCDRVKLVRSNPLGVYSWKNLGDSANKWDGSKLESELNNLYFNSLKGNCLSGEEVSCDFTNTGLNKDAISLIDKALYFTGGIDSDKLSTMYVDDYYKAERLGSNNYVGYVGLMYASDYLYSVLNIESNKAPYLYHYDVSSWLKLSAGGVGHEYLFNPVNDSNNVLRLNYNFGNVSNLKYNDKSARWEVGNVTDDDVVRPVVYLKDGVRIIDGVGSEENPYTLK